MTGKRAWLHRLAMRQCRSHNAQNGHVCPRVGRYVIMPKGFWQLQPIHWHKLFVSETLPQVAYSTCELLSRVGLPASTDPARNQQCSPVPRRLPLAGVYSSVGACLPRWAAWPRPLAALGGRQWIHTHHRLPCPIVGIKPLPTNALALLLLPILGATRSTPTPTINPPSL